MVGNATFLTYDEEANGPLANTSYPALVPVFVAVKDETSASLPATPCSAAAEESLNEPTRPPPRTVSPV